MLLLGGDEVCCKFISILDTAQPYFVAALDPVLGGEMG